MQRIRDEAHRTAITHHRGLRDKAFTHSALDDVPGIGPKRRKALLKHFGSLKAVKAASPEALAAAEGMNAAAARAVFRHFHPEDDPERSESR